VILRENAGVAIYTVGMAKVAPVASAAAPGPCRLMVSVRTAEEAVAAVAAGADFLDCKDPSRGPLGMLHGDLVADICSAVGGKVPVSAALGEWEPDILTAAYWHLDLPITYVKWGLAGYVAGPGWGEDLLDARRKLPTKIHAVMVAYADFEKAKSPAPMEIAKFAKRYRYSAFLLDTFEKKSKHLFQIMKPAAVAEVLAMAKLGGGLAVVGGSLGLEQLNTARQVGADVIAVRGGVCVGGRNGDLDPARVKKFAAAAKENVPNH
jgi:(5-formylfuran-3-yl)methyl phosphate synthase